MIFEYNYQGLRERFYRRYGNKKFKCGASAEGTWLWDQGEMQYDERDRLITLLPLIRYEVEQGLLTEELHDEVELYYEDYKAGKFDGLLGDDEIEEIEKDLFWSYEHRDDHPLSTTIPEELQ